MLQTLKANLEVVYLESVLFGPSPSPSGKQKYVKVGAYYVHPMWEHFNIKISI